MLAWEPYCNVTVAQINTHTPLNLHNIICQLHLNWKKKTFNPIPSVATALCSPPRPAWREQLSQGNPTSCLHTRLPPAAAASLIVLPFWSPARGCSRLLSHCAYDKGLCQADCLGPTSSSAIQGLNSIEQMTSLLGALANLSSSIT